MSREAAEETLWPKRLRVPYRPPTEEQRRALAELIAALWRGVEVGPAVELAQLARRSGMTLELWTVAGQATWVVREPETARRGIGTYLVRAQPPAPGRAILLQTPHAYFDLETSRVAARMFWADGAPATIRGLFSNSLHRFQQDGGVRERREFNAADVAHNAEHPFQTATGAVLDAGPVVVIQLHGFGDDDEQPERPEVEAIVSAGRADGSTAESSAIAATVTEVLGARTARYPEDGTTLGGTTNVQGRLIATTTTGRFVHVEMALDLRRRALDAALAARWARAIATALDQGSSP